jgi:hypothetical protein
MTTKKQYLEEAVHYLGEYNELSKLYKPTRKMLKDEALKAGIESHIQERVVLKRVLRSKKIKFDDNLPTSELVQLARLVKVNFDKLDY